MLVSKQPAGLVWQRGPSCFGNRRLLHAPRVWAGAFRPRVCGGPAGATRTFLGDRPFRATSEWLLVGSRHSVVSSRARGRWPGLWRQRLHRHCRECRTSGLCPGRWSCARGSAPCPQRHKFKNGSELLGIKHLRLRKAVASSFLFDRAKCAALSMTNDARAIVEHDQRRPRNR